MESFSEGKLMEYLEGRYSNISDNVSRGHNKRPEGYTEYSSDFTSMTTAYNERTKDSLEGEKALAQFEERKTEYSQRIMALTLKEKEAEINHLKQQKVEQDREFEMKTQILLDKQKKREREMLDYIEQMNKEIRIQLERTALEKERLLALNQAELTRQIKERATSEENWRKRFDEQNNANQELKRSMQEKLLKDNQETTVSIELWKKLYDDQCIAMHAMKETNYQILKQQKQNNKIAARERRELKEETDRLRAELNKTKTPKRGLGKRIAAVFTGDN